MEEGQVMEYTSRKALAELIESLRITGNCELNKQKMIDESHLEMTNLIISRCVQKVHFEC
jgi:hypothetical protein